MNEDRRCELVELPRGTFTFQGEIAIVAGWKREHEASVTTCLPGFYRASWDEIERAAQSDGVIKNAYFVSGLWLGCKKPE